MRSRISVIGRAVGLLIALLLTVGSLSADSVLQIWMPSRGLIYDPFTRRILAAVPGRAGQIGNSLVAIDPMTGAVGAPVFVGSEPGEMALSDDGQYLYVSLDGAAAVRRLPTPFRTAELQFPIGVESSWGPLLEADLAVLPGHPESLAIAREDSFGQTTFPGVAVYDNGVARPSAFRDAFAPSSIAFSGAASRLYGYNVGGGFYRLTVDPSGVSVLDEARDLVQYPTSAIRFDAGLIDTDSGTVIDPDKRTVVGRFALPAPGGLMAPDAAVGRVFFLTGDGPIRKLTAFDRNSFLPVGSLTLSGVAGTAGDLVRWGIDGLAFRTDQDQIVLLRTHLVGAGDLLLTLQPAAVIGGRQLLGRITLAGPAPGAGAVVMLASHDPAVQVPAQAVVPAGADTVTFPIATRPVGTSTPVEISASLDSFTRRQTLTLLPSTLVSVTVDPDPVMGGLEATGTVTVSDAPVQDLTLSLSSADPAAAAVPPTVTIPAGLTSATFPVHTSHVAADRPVTITASSLGQTQSGTLKLLAIGLQSVTLSPMTILGGTVTTATVTLTAPASADGATILLSTQDAVLLTLADHPFQLPIAAGQTSSGLTIVADRVTIPTTATVAATYGGVTKTAMLTILPDGASSP